MSSTLKPWREVVAPHTDVLRGTFQQAEFAADLSRVHAGTATPEYQDPVLFFERTYITEGMRLLLDSVVHRLAGTGGDPIIQLQTAFGGGKTHTMLAVYHLAKGTVPASRLAGVPPILDAAGVIDPPKARIVVIDGTKLAPNMPEVHGSISVRTLWGQLAWQLGGEAAYNRIADADISGTSPGKEVLASLIADYAPCVILIDELVAYVRQFDEGTRYTGGSYDAILSFVQALTEALKAVPTAVLLAALPESDREAGSIRGINALKTLEHFFARVQALWKPVAAEEAFEIVRRRLFETASDPAGREAVCRAFADTYHANPADFPPETQETRYYQRLINAYPVHPEVFDRLYEDWSSLPTFQRTRGVLKLMAKVIYRLWQDGNNDLMILPGNLPLYDGDVRNEIVYYLPPGWDPVVERDIDGPKAETTAIERADTRFGAVHACRRAARTIFLGSGPGTSPNTVIRGIDLQSVLLGSIQPGQQIGIFKDATKRCVDRLHYLNSAGDHYWFDTQPTLRREMESRKDRFNEIADLYPVIRADLSKLLHDDLFDGIHVFTQSADIPDDYALRLVVLPPSSPYGRSSMKEAEWAAATILKNRGDQPRQRQNRLIFLAADSDVVSRLLDHVRTWLAWDSILIDYNEKRLVLDNLVIENAKTHTKTARDTVTRTIREAYRFLLEPTQVVRDGRPEVDVTWEVHPIGTGERVVPAAEIKRVLISDEVVIIKWAPALLTPVIQQWYWHGDQLAIEADRLWKDFGTYLYLPRLRNERILTEAIEKDSDTRDYFGIAASREGEKYLGFTFGKPRSGLISSATLLIRKDEAERYEMSIAPPERPADPVSVHEPEPRPGYKPDIQTGLNGQVPKINPTTKNNVRFYGQIDLNPVMAKIDFGQIVDEITELFTARASTSVRIKIEIEAEDEKGFDEALQRSVRENCTTLKFRSHEFE